MYTGGRGLTDHIWSLREVLLLRVPLGPQPHGAWPWRPCIIVEVERWTCVQTQAKRVGRGLANPFQVRIIG